MRDGEQRAADVHRGGASPGATVQHESRRPAAPNDLDVLPDDALGVSSSQGFHCRFLGREPAREVRRRISAPRTISNFSVREDATKKAVPVALEHVGDAGNVGGVESDSENIHDRTPA